MKKTFWILPNKACQGVYIRMKHNIEELSKQLGGSIGKLPEICRKLCLIPEIDALKVLVNLTSHKDHYYRSMAAIYISRHPLGSNAISNLLELLNDKHEYVVVAARESITSIHHEYPIIIEEKEVAGLLTLLHSNNTKVALEAAKVLLLIDRPELRQQFIKMLESETPELKSIAIEVIGKFNHKEDFELIFEIYEHENVNDQVTRAAALAAYNLASSLTWQKLFEKFKHGDSDLKLLACKMAMRFAGKADVEHILDLTEDTDIYVRLAAYEALHTARGESLDPARLSKKNLINYNKKAYPQIFADESIIEYSFCENQELNDRVTYLLNDAFHVFDCHPGDWKTVKDYYAKKLAKEIKANSWLGPRMLDIKDRVISMLVYRAYEIIDEELTTGQKNS